MFGLFVDENSEHSTVFHWSDAFLGLRFEVNTHCAGSKRPEATRFPHLISFIAFLPDTRPLGGVPTLDTTYNCYMCKI